MLLNHLRHLFQCGVKKASVLSQSHRMFYGITRVLQSTKPLEAGTSSNVSIMNPSTGEPDAVGITTTDLPKDLFPTRSSRVVPMLLSEREPVVLPFDSVPGPSSLKLLAKARNYLSQTGTQLTAGALILGINMGAYVTNQKPTSFLSTLFDVYGPVVRFVSPIGGDIVLINHPHHIQQVFAMEGEHPVRSLLDSLEKYRAVHRNNGYTGLYNLQGQEWSRQRKILYEPLHHSLAKNMIGLEHVCDTFVEKISNTRNCHDELNKDVYGEVHKWAFDCMGHLIFSKKFTMLNTEIVYSQCDMSWLYHGLENSTSALLKCESGLQMWKVVPTLAWNSLVKYCDILENLIGKYVCESEQKLVLAANLSTKSEDLRGKSLINSLLVGDEKLSQEDICTVLMDMLLLGVNTVSSSMSFLLYFLAKHQKAQKILFNEVEKVDLDLETEDISNIKQKMPYLHACVKENLRLVPPIPVLTRVLQKNLILDKYNIPRGTLIIMSTQDASLKESNFDDASRFKPDRWLKPDAKEYHAFASIPFGFGSRKCLGQNIAETMLCMMTYKIIQKFKMEYHYGDIQPTRTFIVKPNKPLKIRFVDRL